MGLTGSTGKERRAELRARVGTELYADGCSYYYGLRPAELLELLDALDVMEAELDEARFKAEEFRFLVACISPPYKHYRFSWEGVDE